MKYHTQASSTTNNLRVKIDFTIPGFSATKIVMRKDIFQQKMNYLFCGFEFIRDYIDDLFILTKGYCTNNVQKLGLTLNKLRKKDSNVTLKSLSSENPKYNI